MKKSNHFFIVGAQRSGTTYLYGLLDEHPEIKMATPVYPEPKFFLDDEQYNKGLEFYTQQYFGANDDLLLGEKGTSYIESEKAAQRIATCFPNAMIVFILREPLNRAVSNYWFSVKNGFETLSLWEAFSAEEERINQFDSSQVSASPYAYLRRGHYLDYISMYKKYFPEEQLIVLVYEKLVLDPSVLTSLYSSLGVASDFQSASRKNHPNKGGYAEGELSAQQISSLRKRFMIPNKRLAETFHLDLSLWN